MNTTNVVQPHTDKQDKESANNKIAGLISSTILCLTGIGLGAQGFNLCFVQPNIPVFLIAINSVLLVANVVIVVEMYYAGNETVKMASSILELVLYLSVLGLAIAGAVWIFEAWEYRGFCPYRVYYYALAQDVIFLLGSLIGICCGGIAAFGAFCGSDDNVVDVV